MEPMEPRYVERIIEFFEYRMRAQGRSHASECFSEELFDRRFRACIEPLLR